MYFKLFLSEFRKKIHRLSQTSNGNSDLINHDEVKWRHKQIFTSNVIMEYYMKLKLRYCHYTMRQKTESQLLKQFKQNSRLLPKSLSDWLQPWLPQALIMQPFISSADGLKAIGTTMLVGPFISYHYTSTTEVWKLVFKNF